MPDLRIIFAGSGEFGLPSLRALRGAGYELVQVITQPDRPAGRGRAMTPTPIGALAVEQNLPLLKTPNINAESLPPADLMVVIAFGQKIAPHVVDHPRLGSINLHASLLPKNRGAAPINAAIITGESETGNSVIRLAQKMDAGAILGQSRLKIGELETAGELHDRLAEDGAPLVLSIIRALAAGTAREVEQDHSRATLAPKMSRESSRIHWSSSAKDIANQIRGMYPWPGCRVQLLHGDEVLDRITLVRARPIDLWSVEPGYIEPSGIVAAAEDSVEVVEVQPEGKRPMSLAAYRNGHRWEAGMRVESIA